MSNATSLIILLNKSIGKGRHLLGSIHSHCEETRMKYGINHLSSGQAVASAEEGAASRRADIS